MSSTLLLILLLVCHYIGDYTHLSTPRMLSAKRIGWPIGPIIMHAAVHAVLMFAVMIYYTTSNIVLGCMLLEFGTHFFIDVLKGKMNVWFPVVADPREKAHWYIFGFDQLLHQVVIVWIWYILTH